MLAIRGGICYNAGSQCNAFTPSVSVLNGGSGDADLVFLKIYRKDGHELCCFTSLLR